MNLLNIYLKKKKPTILSTGLSHQYEIDKAIKTFESTGNKKLDYYALCCNISTKRQTGKFK